MGTRDTFNNWSSDELKERKNQMANELDRGVDRTVDFAKEKANTAKSYVNDLAGEASSAVSKAMDKTVSTVQDGYEAGKQYLADHDIEKIADDFTGVIKKYPVQTLFAGIGLGILIGNTLTGR